MLEDKLTDDELREFPVFHKVMNSHNNMQVYEMFCDDMQKRHGYTSRDHLMDRYLMYLEFTEAETLRYTK